MNIYIGPEKEENIINWQQVFNENKTSKLSRIIKLFWWKNKYTKEKNLLKFQYVFVFEQIPFS